MDFTIAQASDGETDAALYAGSYDKLEAASEALRQALGWKEIWLGPGYTTDDGQNQIWRAYKTRADSEADQAGEAAPRVTRLLDEAGVADPEARANTATAERP